MGTEKILLVTSAPGRIDFLNTHQDYKGLPVVPVAINLRTQVTIVESSSVVEVKSVNLSKEGKPSIDRFDPDRPVLREKGWFGNYLRAVIKAIKDYTSTEFGRGFKAVIESQVPIGSGLASSAALEVSFAKAVSEFYRLDLDVEEIAELSYVAENKIMGIPCGRLDQYGSAYGWSIVLYPNVPRVETLKLRNIDFVVVDSGIRHSVADIHPRRQEEIRRGLERLLSLDIDESLREKLSPRIDEVKWEELSLDELEPYLKYIDEVSARRIRFTILMNESTREAIEIIKRDSKSLNQELGEIVNYQHKLLRDLYEVSLPQLEKIRDAMLDAGAYGVKISGAGMGGSLVAITPFEEEVKENIVKAALKAGASKGWRVRIDKGVRLEKITI